MHTIQKSKAFDDELKLVDDGRELILKIHIDINTGAIPKYRALGLKLLDMEKKGEKDVEEIGRIIVDMMKLLLGDTNTEKIIAFYDGNYTQMLGDVFPYIQQIIVPAMEKMAKERKKQFSKKSWR